jgi:undecaprenyl-diphosphatase
VKQQTHTLDQFSFPSGHTLHAVCFTLIVCGHLPFAIWILTPFALMVAISRPVLGLHYPSDVLAGALIGASIALLSWNIPLFSMIAS